MDEFSEPSFDIDIDKGKVTVGAIEEIRTVQAAQLEGLIGSGSILRSERGADLNIGVIDVSIKAYRDDSVISNPRSLAKLVDSLNADINLHFLFDGRALSEFKINKTTNVLTQK